MYFDKEGNKCDWVFFFFPGPCGLFPKHQRFMYLFSKRSGFLLFLSQCEVILSKADLAWRAALLLCTRQGNGLDITFAVVKPTTIGCWMIALRIAASADVNRSICNGYLAARRRGKEHEGKQTCQKDSFHMQRYLLSLMNGAQIYPFFPEWQKMLLYNQGISSLGR